MPSSYQATRSSNILNSSKFSFSFDPRLKEDNASQDMNFVSQKEDWKMKEKIVFRAVSIFYENEKESASQWCLLQKTNLHAQPHAYSIVTWEHEHCR